MRVEVILHTRYLTLLRSPGAWRPGIFHHLAAGEKVRLSTADRRTRFSFDSETKLSYHSEQISEEQYLMRSMRAFMADENVVDRGEDNYSEQGKWDFHGDASGSIGFFSASADTNARGSHSASSTRDYLREHRGHAEMSDNQSVEATRRAHSISIGEVSTRSHAEGETEDHFEASSREFSNPNKCHAVTFLFYRINKIQKIKFELVAIERRVLDPVAPMPVPANPFRPTGQVATRAARCPGHQRQAPGSSGDGYPGRPEFPPACPERTSLPAAQRASMPPAVLTAAQALGVQVPLADELRVKALAEVDAQLVRQGLIDRASGSVSPRILEEINYERETSIPTAGVIVKSCLDDCDICEPEVHRRTTLELERMELENKLLARQIELLDKSQEYRCCPVMKIESDD